MEAKDAWRTMDKKDKKKWNEKLEPQRQKYIDEYTLFVRGLDKVLFSNPLYTIPSFCELHKNRFKGYLLKLMLVFFRRNWRCTLN